MEVDFKDAPVSLSEKRAAKAHDAALQTPRDALIMMLRDLDSGHISPDMVILCYRDVKDGKVGTFYYAGGNSDYHTGLGLLEAAKQLF